MIQELFQPDLLLIMTNGKMSDENDYFAALFNRQQTWASAVIDQHYIGNYSPDRHVGSMKIRSFPMDALGASWLEFQAWIDTAYGLAKFIAGWQTNLSAADFSYYLTAAGIYQRPTLNGKNVTTLTASDGTVLATGLTTDLQWETAWNTLGVPYERRAGSVALIPPRTNYIRNLAQFGEIAGFFRQSTLLFDGTA